MDVKVKLFSSYNFQTHNTLIELIHVGKLGLETTQIHSRDIGSQYKYQILTEQTVTYADPSPEGVNLIVALVTGSILVYKFNFKQGKGPEKFFSWKPVDKEEKLDSVSYLEDRTPRFSTAQLWRFMVIGFNGNRILKIFGMSDWTCLLTLDFSKMSRAQDPLEFLLDPTGMYGFLYSKNRSFMHILKFSMSEESESDRVSLSQCREVMLEENIAHLRAGKIATSYSIPILVQLKDKLFLQEAPFLSTKENKFLKSKKIVPTFQRICLDSQD